VTALTPDGLPESLTRAIEAVKTLEAFSTADVIAAAENLHRACYDVHRQHPRVLFEVMMQYLKARARRIRFEGKFSGRELVIHRSGSTNVIKLYLPYEYREGHGQIRVGESLWAAVLSPKDLAELCREDRRKRWIKMTRAAGSRTFVASQGDSDLSRLVRDDIEQGATATAARALHGSGGKGNRITYAGRKRANQCGKLGALTQIEAA
jgi:hypothetical protein